MFRQRDRLLYREIRYQKRGRRGVGNTNRRLGEIQNEWITIKSRPLQRHTVFNPKSYSIRLLQEPQHQNGTTKSNVAGLFGVEVNSGMVEYNRNKQKGDVRADGWLSLNKTFAGLVGTWSGRRI